MEAEGAAAAGTRALGRLAAALIAERSVISPFVRAPASGSAGPSAPLGALLAASQRRAGDAELYATVIESVREGYLLHYGSSRLLDAPDRDLALLAGDYLYAKGLEGLAGIGDLDSIRELGDLISLSAQLHAERGSDASDPAAIALWLASTVAIAAGGGAEHEAAKRELRRSGAARPLHQAARRSASRAGLGQPLAIAAEAIGFASSTPGRD